MSCCSACSQPRLLAAAFFGWLEGAFITVGSYKIKALGYFFKTGASNVVTKYALPSRELCTKNWALCLHCLHCLSNTCFGALIARSLVLEAPTEFRFKGFHLQPDLCEPRSDQPWESFPLPFNIFPFVHELQFPSLFPSW